MPCSAGTGGEKGWGNFHLFFIFPSCSLAILLIFRLYTCESRTWHHKYYEHWWCIMNSFNARYIAVWHFKLIIVKWSAIKWKISWDMLHKLQNEPVLTYSSCKADVFTSVRQHKNTKISTDNAMTAKICVSTFFIIPSHKIQVSHLEQSTFLVSLFSTQFSHIVFKQTECIHV